MGGFEKIDLSSGLSSKGKGLRLAGFLPKKMPRFWKNTLRIGIVFAVLVILSIFTIALPVKKTYDSARKTYASAKLVAAYVNSQNVQEAQKELQNTKILLAKTQKDLNSLSFLHFIPLLSWYYNDADHLVKAATYGVEAGEILFDALVPYADVLGLKGQGSFVGGTAEERIRTAVLTMGKVTPRIDNIAEKLVLMRDEVDQIDPNHYPSFLFGRQVHNQLDQFQTLIHDGVTFVDQARPLIKVLPELLGEKEDKKYLILFQNDKELRPTGGFLTGFAIFRMEKGVVRVDRSDDIYTLDDTIPAKPRAPKPILNYLPKVTQFNLRDSNLSPDFVKSMETFLSLYNKSTSRTDVDGIIALDTYVLVSVLEILDGQITAGGINFTSEIDSRCDCPQVIYVLEDNISKPVGYVRTGRKDLLGVLLYALMDKALKSSPEKYWGKLFQDLIRNVQEKHILFYLFDKKVQSSLESLNASGRIRDFDGDYLHINDTSFSGAKTNLFMEQDVDVMYDVKSDGTIEKTVVINYKNTHEPSDCNLERGGLCLNAEYRNWFRIFVPKDSRLINSRGSEVKVSVGEDLGKTFFEGFITVRPLGKSTLTITYTLPFKVDRASPIPFLIQKQPGTDSHEYTVKVNGKTVNKFTLQTDREISVTI